MADPTLFSLAFSPSESTDLHQHFPPALFVLLHSCKAWPISWRKLALTVCRTQTSPLRNTRLQSEIEEIIASGDNLPIVSPFNQAIYTLPDIVNLLDIIHQSPYLCSVMSYVTRAERLESPEVYEEQISKIISKEIHAALHEDRPQQLDYLGLTHPHRRHQTLYHDEWSKLGYQTLQDWQRGVQITGPSRWLYTVTCIRDPPLWYNAIVADDGPE